MLIDSPLEQQSVFFVIKLPASPIWVPCALSRECEQNPHMTLLIISMDRRSATTS